MTHVSTETQQPISSKWHALQQHARVDAGVCPGIIRKQNRAKEEPCPGCSAFCTPALFSRAALSACLRTPPPAAPPSVSAAGRVQKVSERDTLSPANHITNLPVWPCCETALASLPRMRNSENSFNEYNILRNKNNRIKPFED